MVNARLSGTIAHLRGYDVRSEDVQTVVLVSLLGSAGSSVLKDAGVTAGNKAVVATIKKVPGRALIEINKKVGFRLVTKAGEKGVVNLTKLAPLVGAPVGGTIDALSCRSVGAYAQRYFTQID